MFDSIIADTRRLRIFKRKSFPWYVLESLLFDNGYQAVVLFRISSWFKRRRIPVFGPFFNRLSILLTSVDIAPGAEVGPGLLISHGMGLVVGESARIGTDAILHNSVSIGASALARIAQMPRIGDAVFIGAGARLIGDIEIGDNVFIGANAVVGQDVPADHRVVAAGGLKIVPRGQISSPREADS
jgi:serine O-acetyltransferase